MRASSCMRLNSCLRMTQQLCSLYFAGISLEKPCRFPHAMMTIFTACGTPSASALVDSYGAILAL